MKKIIIVNNKKLHLSIGHTKEEWEYIHNPNTLWDFPIEELLDGTIEINESIWYWLINGRCYESDEEVMNN